MSPENLVFDQLHIDVARNSTDDFNPFHDPKRWKAVHGNPFPGPIALGFQLEFLCSDRIVRERAALQIEADPDFRNFEFNFAGALPAGEAVAIDVRKTVDKRETGGGLSNRVVLRRTDGSPVLIGSQSDTATPRFWQESAIEALHQIKSLPDRSIVPDSTLFLKRKYLTTSNAKNFTAASLCEQQEYIDELAERIRFPALFTAAMSSCALLERALASGHDFKANPLVYTNHQISVDMRLQAQLRSNDVILFLVSEPELIDAAKGLGGTNVDQYRFHCTALLEGGEILFQARLQLASLAGFTGGDAS
ncbi:MAG: hypothetical protein AAF933_16690 [Pseudomonadota bacterium]